MPFDFGFKEREGDPKYLKVTYSGFEEPRDTFVKRLYGLGFLNFGYHYFVHKDGSIEKGVPLVYTADPTLPMWDNAIHVLVMGSLDEKLSTMQEKSLRSLSEELKLPIRR